MTWTCAARFVVARRRPLFTRAYCLSVVRLQFFWTEADVGYEEEANAAAPPNEELVIEEPDEPTGFAAFDALLQATPPKGKAAPLKVARPTTADARAAAKARTKKVASGAKVAYFTCRPVCHCFSFMYNCTCRRMRRRASANWRRRQSRSALNRRRCSARWLYTSRLYSCALF